MLNMIPVWGWLMDFGLKLSMAVPFWFVWTYCELGKKYFYFLPAVFQSIPFWHVVGLFIAVPIAYLIFVPRLVSVSQTNK